jgi:serine/threonine protein kinase
MDSMAPTPFDPFTVKSFIFQLLQGVAYCHRNYIMHRDLKPQNLLVDDNAILKVADFGLARPFSPTLSKYSAEVVTLWYRAPELLLGQEDYDSSVDIWSVGCIMCELVNGTPLFTGASEYSQLKAIFSLLGTPEDDDGGDNFGINNGNGGDSGQFDREKKNKDKGSEENGHGGKTEGGVGHGPNQVSTNEGSKDNTTNRVNKDGKGNLRSGPVGLAGNSRKIDKESINSLPGYKEFLSHHSMAMKNDDKKPTDDSLLQKNTKNDQNSDPSIIKQHRTLPFPTPHGDICIPPTPWEQICPRLQGVGLDLLSKLLTLNPRLRISADEALTHPFFADLIVVNAEDFEHVK